MVELCSSYLVLPKCSDVSVDHVVRYHCHGLRHNSTTLVTMHFSWFEEAIRDSLETNAEQKYLQCHLGSWLLSWSLKWTAMLALSILAFMDGIIAPAMLSDGLWRALTCVSTQTQQTHHYKVVAKPFPILSKLVNTKPALSSSISSSCTKLMDHINTPIPSYCPVGPHPASPIAIAQLSTRLATIRSKQR